MDLDISFDGKAMCTPVYIKMDAMDQLVLAEATVRVESEVKASNPLILQPEAGLLVEESLLTVQDDWTDVSLVNLTGFTWSINSGTSVSDIDEEVQFLRKTENTMVSATVNHSVNILN